MAIRVHGRYCSSHKTRGTRDRTTTYLSSLAIHPSHVEQTRTKRLIPQTGKMRLRAKRDRLPRRHCQKRQTTNGSKETKRRRRLAQTQHSNGNPQIPGVYRLLPLLYPRIFKDRTPTT